MLKHCTVLLLLLRVYSMALSGTFSSHTLAYMCRVRAYKVRWLGNLRRQGEWLCMHEVLHSVCQHTTTHPEHCVYLDQVQHCVCSNLMLHAWNNAEGVQKVCSSVLHTFSKQKPSRRLPIRGRGIPPITVLHANKPRLYCTHCSICPVPFAETQWVCLSCLFCSCC